MNASLHPLKAQKQIFKVGVPTTLGKVVWEFCQLPNIVQMVLFIQDERLFVTDRRA